MITNLLKNLKFSHFLIVLFLFTLTTGCGMYRKTDARKIPVNVNERVEKNIQEGRGFRVFDKARQKGGSGVFEFASSNPMWRASIDLLDFAPFSNVDYSGGIIITDWYYDNNSSRESIKISLRFLSNDIRSESLKVIVHKKTCANTNNCKIVLLEQTSIKEELHATILKKAAQLERDAKEKKK